MTKKCIFCGGSGKKSKEHIWSEWMHDLLPKQGDGYHVSEIHTAKWDEHLNSNQSKRQGYLTTKKLRVVCRTCNSGWMSKLETSVKPILGAILREESLDLSNQDQATLSRWAAMKVIVGEHSERKTRVTPFEDRYGLMKNGKIPDYFYICIGKHSEKYNCAWLRTSYTLALSKSGPRPPLGKKKRNSQSIGMVIGPLFIWVLAIRHDNIRSDNFVKFNKVQPIYPVSDTVLTWPIKSELTDSQMSKIIYSLNDIKYQPNVDYGGDLPGESIT